MLLARAGHLSCRHVQHYIEDVVASQQDVSVVCYQLIVSGFSCSFQEYVHVSIALDHFALILAAVLEHDRDSSVQLLDKHVERLLARFHVSTLVFEYNYS